MDQIRSAKTPLAQVIIPSPIGPLLLVASDNGVVRVEFEKDGFDRTDHAVPASSKQRSILDQATQEINEYFAGERREFSVPLDLSLPPGFRRRVSDELRRVPYGVRITYGELARRAGSARAARAVGSVCANNPVPILIPCHRVVRADLTIGAYGGGTAAKDYLLSMEERSSDH